jgi:hypothetical protein
MHEAEVNTRAKRMTNRQTLLTRWKKAPEAFTKDPVIAQWGSEGRAA